MFGREGGGILVERVTKSGESSEENLSLEYQKVGIISEKILSKFRISFSWTRLVSCWTGVYLVAKVKPDELLPVARKGGVGNPGREAFYSAQPALTGSFSFSAKSTFSETLAQTPILPGRVVFVVFPDEDAYPSAEVDCM